MKKYIPLMIVVGLLLLLLVIIFYLLQSRQGGLVQKVNDDSMLPIEQASPISFEEAVIYTCNEGSKIATSFVAGDNTKMELSVPNFDPIIAVQTESASGARYVAETGLTFWEKGGEVLVEQGDIVLFKNCLKLDHSKEVTELPVVVTAGLPLDMPLIWVKTVLKNDEVITPNKEGDFALTFSKEGRFSANTDCNNMGGEYSVNEDGALSFSNMVSTLMACDGDIKEGAFAQMLDSATEVKIADGEINITLDEGGVMYFKQ